MYQKILVPVDGSDTSTLGLLEAIKLAHGTHAQLQLVHVVNTMVSAIDYAAGPGSTIDPAIRSSDEDVAALKSAESLVKQNGLDSEPVLLSTVIDNVGELIIRQAKQWTADIIVMGTHGRRGLGRLVLGSHAEYVLRHTQVPVLLVRKQSGN
jgi:nucleotide-binding universal stress UspA family protein